MKKTYDYLVLGLGITGLSCVRFLASKGFKVAAADSREQPPSLAVVKSEMPGVDLYLGNLSPQLVQQTKELVVSPGLSLEEPIVVEAQQAGVPVIGDLELFARYVTAPVIAITGTNGKSTVTKLVAEMIQDANLKVAVGGNLGTGALDLLKHEDPDYYVLELSSFQLDLVESLAPEVAVLLNVTADHLDRHHTFEAYKQAKHRIYKNAKFAVYNLDDPNTVPPQTIASVGFSLNKINQYTWVIRNNALSFGNTEYINVANLTLCGRHNWANAMAALAIARHLNLPREPILKSIEQFSGLEHRCQWVGQINKIDLYNDSKATNVGASIAAIEGLAAADKRDIILIVGGQAKGDDFALMCPAVSQYVHQVIVLGEAAPLITKRLQDVVAVTHASDMQNAVETAVKLANPGDKILLAPACASFDMFRNFEHRGEVFTKCVQRLRGRN